MNMLRALLIGTMVLCPCLLVNTRLADGCAVATGSGVGVTIADESAVIVWDEASKTQHFIRRAVFTTEGKHFGFLVPTPTQPTLGEASDEAFTMLNKIVAVPIKVKGGSFGGATGKSPVEVLDQKRIAGQDVVVLKATDADALGNWLTKHGYDFSAGLKNWVKPYIDAKWIITASKIAKDKDGVAIKNVASTAVRMTFKTEKPFFPYSEPAEQPAGKAQPSRLLRVFFIGAAKMEGSLGAKGEQWPGKVVWSNKLVALDREKLLDHFKLPQSTAPASWYLTCFEDRSSPRPGTADVYFTAAAAQKK